MNDRTQLLTALEAKKEQIRSAILQKKAAGKFEDYCRYVGGVEPARHHRVMCDAFQPIVEGEQRFILINAPPGSAKSTYASHLFPAYYASKTGKLVLSGCHTYPLAEAFGKKVRTYVSSEKNLKVFPDAPIRKDTRAASNWALENGAEYFGCGVGGGSAGKRADLLIVEDPYPNKKAAKSPAYRKEVADWFKIDLFPRLRPGGSVIVIFTRWDIRDLANDIDDIEEKTGVPWIRIKFEAIREDMSLEDPLGRQPGEALWPEWQSVDDLMLLKNTSLEEDWFSLYQQKPPNKIDLEDTDLSFESYDPRIKRKYQLIFQSWDAASSSDGNPSACVTFGYRDGIYDILDVYDEKLLYPGLKRSFVDLQAKWDSKLAFVENASNGRSLIQDYKHKFNIVEVNPKKYGNKVERQEYTFPVIESGRVRLPEGDIPWVRKFLQQFFDMIEGKEKEDDIVDAFSQGIIKAEESLITKRGRRRRMVPLQGAA